MSQRFMLQEGSYEITPMAEGGTAHLFLARPVKGDGHPLTLKTLKKELARNPITAARFCAECEIMQQLHHPSTPKLRDFNDQRRPYLAYDYIEGFHLLRLLQELHQRGRSVPLQVATELMGELLDILAYLHGAEAHKRPIVHGDISPENIIVKDEHPSLIDFGSALYIEQSSQASQATCLGKPSYMSPEQAKGLPWDQRSDLYQAGVVFFELLAGQKYIKGNDQRETILIASNPQPLDIRDKIPEQSEALQGFLDTILAPNPDQRFPNAEEAAQALRAIF